MIAKGQLYTVWETAGAQGVVYQLVRTRDLSHWEILGEFPDQPIALAYWPAHDAIVASSPGETAGIWWRQIPGELHRLFTPLIFGQVAR